MKKILFSGIFLYLFLTPFFFHPDLKIIYHHSQYLSKGIFNIYSYLDQNPTQASLGQFVYPPLTYLFFGLIFPLINLLAGPDFISWLGMGNIGVGVPHLFRYLFLMKLPLVILHILTGLILTKLINNKKTVLALWLFNPISIYSVALMGQFDILPVFLTVLSLYFFIRRPVLAAFILGLGASIKTYPLLLIPFMTVMSKEKIKVLISGLIPYSLFIIPFLWTPAFVESVFASGLAQRLFQMGISIGYDKTILLVPAVILFLFYSVKNIEKSFLTVLLVVLAGSHFHPQWVLWPLPFLCLYLVKTKKYWMGLAYVCSWIAVTLLFSDPFIIFGLLSPLNPEVQYLPSIISILPSSLPWLNLAQTLFFATSAWIAYENHNSV